ncbi:MAG: hypothetical protein LBM94_04815 [Propionibacteriaceae bacterium]|nr:hypothetical protein [Propionibacteriaceae bacterium]
MNSKKRFVALAITACVAAGILPAPQQSAAAAFTLPPGIHLVSTPDGTNGAEFTYQGPTVSGPRVSEDGTVVFQSNASNLPGFVASDVFQVYLWTPDNPNTVTLLSTPDGTTGGSQSSGAPEISANGTVVFTSLANNLPGNSRNDDAQVYLWTKEDGLTLVSSVDGVNGALGQSARHQINDDGSVVFASTATDLPGSVPGVRQVYLWTKDDGLTLISSPDGSVGGNGESDYPQISAAGSVVFSSSANNLPGNPGGNPVVYQVYLWTKDDGLTLISTSDGSNGASGKSYEAQINVQGNIVFTSDATDLPGNANGGYQTYLWTPAGGVELISSPDGGITGANGYSQEPQINANDVVVFYSDAPEMPGNASGASQVYMWTRAGGLELISSPDGGTTGGNEASIWSRINSHGAIVFSSMATDLPGNPLYGDIQVYMWTRAGGLELITSADGGTTGASGETYEATITDSGLIAFRSTADDLPGNPNGKWQAYLRFPPRSTDATLASYTAGGVSGGSLGTPQATYNDASIVPGAVTLTPTEAANADLSAVATHADATLRYAYTATDTDPTAAFSSTWTPQALADGSYVWIEVTADDPTSVLIYKIAITVTAPAGPVDPGNPGGPGNPGNPGGGTEPGTPGQLPWTGSPMPTSAPLAGLLIMCGMVALTVVNRKVSRA